MEVKSKRDVLKIVVVAAIISSLLLAITAVIPSVADTQKYLSSNTGTEIDVNAEKTVEWNDDTHTNGTIKITAGCQGRGVFIPEVLFMGTMCSAHSLKTETVTNSLNAIALTSNVDYFMFNNNKESHTTPDTSGHLDKGSKLTNPINIVDVSNHQAMGKFLECIYTQHKAKVQENGKGYDFIVMEFDGTRISDWYRNLKPKNDSSSVEGIYNKFDHEADVVEILKSYYNNNQVIWITDTVGGYKPTTKMHVRNNEYDTRKINYNTLKGLLAPSLYTPVTDTSLMSVEEITAYEATLDDSINDDVPDKYILGTDRQTDYTNSATVGTFLSNAIHDVYLYTLVIKDKIDLADNIKITTNSVKLYTSTTGEKDSWVPYEGGDEQITISDNGEVEVQVPNLEGDKFFQLRIGFEDKSSGQRFVDVSLDGNPNDGPATVSVDPKAGEEKIDTPETQKPLDWEIPIYYVVEDRYKSTEGISVSNENDNITTSSTKAPEGSKAIETSNIKFQYWSTDIGGKDTFVSNEFNLVPQPDLLTNRYHKATYIAHFAESPVETKTLTVKKVWSDGDDFHLNDSITVHLFAMDITGKEAKLGSNIILDASNKWTYTTIYEYQIYDVDGTTPLRYHFVEDEVEGYVASYDVDSSNPKTLGNTIITNTYTNPPGPGPQPTPSPTPDPGKVTPVGYGSIKTGDIVEIISLLVFAVVGSASIAVISRIRKKNKERG